jgi:hypothetical protein
LFGRVLANWAIAWANFRQLGDCLLCKAFWKSHTEEAHISTLVQSTFLLTKSYLDTWYVLSLSLYCIEENR